MSADGDGDSRVIPSMTVIGIHDVPVGHLIRMPFWSTGQLAIATATADGNTPLIVILTGEHEQRNGQPIKPPFYLPFGQSEPEQVISYGQRYAFIPSQELEDTVFDDISMLRGKGGLLVTQAGFHLDVRAFDPYRGGQLVLNIETGQAQERGPKSEPFALVKAWKLILTDPNLPEENRVILTHSVDAV